MPWIIHVILFVCAMYHSMLAKTGQLKGHARKNKCIHGTLRVKVLSVHAGPTVKGHWQSGLANGLVSKKGPRAQSFLGRISANMYRIWTRRASLRSCDSQLSNDAGLIQTRYIFVEMRPKQNWALGHVFTTSILCDNPDHRLCIWFL